MKDHPLVLTIVLLFALPYRHSAAAEAIPESAASTTERSQVDSSFESLLAEAQSLQKQGDSAREQAIAASQARQSTKPLIDQEITFYDRAIAVCTRLLEHEPRDANVYKLRGLLYAKRDRDGRQSMVFTENGMEGVIADFGSESINNLTRAIELSPRDGDALISRAKIYIMQFHNKYLMYRRLVIRDQSRDWSDHRPDVALAKNALSDLQTAVEMGPDFCAAYFEVGELFFLTAQYEESIENFQRSLGCAGSDDATANAKISAAKEALLNRELWAPGPLGTEFRLQWSGSKREGE